MTMKQKPWHLVIGKTMRQIQDHMAVELQVIHIVLEVLKLWQILRIWSIKIIKIQIQVYCIKMHVWSSLLISIWVLTIGRQLVLELMKRQVVGGFSQVLHGIHIIFRGSLTEMVIQFQVCISMLLVLVVLQMDMLADIHLTMEMRQQISIFIIRLQ